jgi:exonuclease VII small subunit
MNKTQLLAQIDELLEDAIDAYEVTDLKLEETDNGTLHTINVCLEQAIEAFRRARRSGRTLMKEYNDDLSQKPEYMEQGAQDDEDEDEADDEDED